MDSSQLIIVKRIKHYAAGHHDGSWKVAFADFITAMMAFFLVLWLLSSVISEQKKAISGYFQNPIGSSESVSSYIIDLDGMSTPVPGKIPNPRVQVQPDSSESRISPEQDYQTDADQAESLAEQAERERLTLLLQELQNKVDGNPMPKGFKDQVHFRTTRDGLRIQVIDTANRPVFGLGSARLQPYSEGILLVVAETTRQIPNKISINSHADAKPYAGSGDFDNWGPSANHANAIRCALVTGGYPEGQITRVVEYVSVRLSDDKGPLNPMNRWTDIAVLTREAQRAIEGETGAPEVSVPAIAPDEQSKPTAEAPMAGTQPSLPVNEVQKKPSLFDDGSSLRLGQARGD